MKLSLKFCLFVLCNLMSVSSALAEKLNLHGFVAQGIIQAKDANFVEDDGSTSLKLTEIGLNASYRVSSTLRVAGQGVYLNGGNRYPEGVRVDYLFLDWQVINNDAWHVKFQLGRNKNYHWLYSSTRDVPHTRPSIVLPQSIYFDAFRDVALGVDGLVFIAQTNNRLGEWDINFSSGKSDISDEQKRNLLGDAEGILNHDKDIQGSVYWRPTLSHFQFGISLLDADFSYEQSENDLYFSGDETSQRIMLNLLYQGKYWEIASEVFRERVVVKDILFPGYFSDAKAEGGFVQARYFVSPNLTYMARLDIFDRDRKDRKGNNIVALSMGQVPGYFGFMDQATLGVSWRFAQNTQLQVEYHRVKGTGRLAPVFNPDIASNNSKYWDMWALQLMYWF